jgi:hypothetical protein
MYVEFGRKKMGEKIPKKDANSLNTPNGFGKRRMK